MESSSRSASPWSSSTFTRDRPTSILEDGILTGMMGAAVVAAWFFILDTVQGRMLFTPSLLGSVVFLGQSPEQPVSVNGFVVFASTGLHVLLFFASSPGCSPFSRAILISAS